VVYPVTTNEAMTTESERYICFSGMEKMPSQNMPVQRLKVAFLLLDLPWFGFITHSGEIQTTGKSNKKKPGGLFTKDDLEVRKVL
jgi:hypothetical protein